VRAAFFLTLAALVLLRVWLWRRRTRVVDGDLAVLRRLAKGGSNLSKSHPIDFFLYFPNEQAAEGAAAELRNDGFGAQVQRGADEGNWLCHATRSLVPAHAELVAIRARLEGIAASRGGQYDGWGTPIVP